MEMMNVMYELANTKTALELAEKTIRKQRGKLLRRNLIIAGLAWLGFTACRMLGESDEKLKKAEAKARDMEAELAMMHHNYDQHGEEEKDSLTAPKKVICCDGKASITKKPE